MADRPVQPKRVIADYVSSEGISTPERFSTLRDARASGKPYIIRSEHPQDYEGISGLLSSIQVSDQSIADAKRYLKDEKRPAPDFLNAESVKGWMTGCELFSPSAETALLPHVPKYNEQELQVALYNIRKEYIEKYCKLLKINESAFREKCTFSYWEYVQGNNYTVVADTAIHNRYHIFCRVCEPQDVFGYIAPDQLSSIAEDSPQVAAQTNDVIRMYEDVRSLGKFSPQHCPIMEMQTNQDDGKPRFLQYLRTNDFQEATHSIKKHWWTRGWSDTGFVRGATPPEGIEVLARVCPYYSQMDQLPEREDCAFPSNNDFVTEEIMLRRTDIQFLRPHSLSGIFMGHVTLSQRFKPRIVIDIKVDDLVKKKGGWEYFIKHPEEMMHLRVIADGLQALVKILR